MKLRKSLGQHLLSDTETLQRTAAASGAAPGGLCLEIGPGTGYLTAALLETGARVTAVEIDENMAAELFKRLGGEERLTIVREDILKADLDEIIPPAERPAVAAGNLPYYITSPIIFKLLEYPGMFSRITVLTQEEVGDRIAAAPGSRDYGMLSVFCQAAADCEKLFPVRRELFKPPPRVDSCVVALTPNLLKSRDVADRAAFDLTVKGAFEHRRKTCYNSLRISVEKGACGALFPKKEDIGVALRAAFEQAGINPLERPEKMSLEAFIALSNSIAEIRSRS